MFVLRKADRPEKFFGSGSLIAENESAAEHDRVH